MKKEEIVVKLTKKNILKVVKILEKYRQKCHVFHSITILKNNIFEKLYLFYSADFNLWITSETKPKDKTLIKPKQLKELLDGEPPYTSKYWDNPLWQRTKGGIGDKGAEYIPENKTLEVGKWYKCQGFDHKGNDTQIMFLFNGIKGNEGKTIGFDNNGEYCDNISIYDTSVETFQEAPHQEVIQSFVYHMETFANKSKRKKTNNQQSQEEDCWIKPEGVRMLVWDANKENAVERIVLAKLPENASYRYLCVNSWSETQFKEGEKFYTVNFKNAKPILKIKEITMQEIADKLKIKK